MVKGESDTLVRHLRTLFEVGASGDLTDGQLLDRYRGGSGEAAGLAFAAIVDRHGPMVLAACRAVLRDHQDACDAFQATFLVLIRRAPSLMVRDSLGAWLHQVAHRTALCARADTARRRRLELRAAELVETHRGEGNDELGAVLHEEIARLPDRYRAAVVLCLLEGLTREQAARRLGCPTGTVESRLARARERLRARLVRRGIASAVAGAAIASTADGALASLPAGIAESIIGAAMRFAACGDTAGATSASVAALADRTFRSILMTKLKTAAATLAVLGGVAIGAVAIAQNDGEDRGGNRREPRREVKARSAVSAADRALASVLKIPGPAKGERMEISIQGSDGSRDRMTLEPVESGKFVVTRDHQSKQGHQSVEMLCTSIEIQALLEPVQAEITFSNPKTSSPAEFKDVRTTVTEDHEHRLSRMEQKLEQILKALEIRDDNALPGLGRQPGR